MPDTETLEPAPVPAAEKPFERAGFRLAAFVAVLVVVLFAGYGMGRLNDGGTESSRTAGQSAAGATNGQGGPGDSQGGPAASDSAGSGSATGDGHGHGADAQGGAAAPHDDTGTAPHVHNADGSVTPTGGGGTAGESVGGLALTSQGLTLAPVEATLPGGQGADAPVQDHRRGRSADHHLRGGARQAAASHRDPPRPVRLPASAPDDGAGRHLERSAHAWPRRAVTGRSPTSPRSSAVGRWPPRWAPT